MGQEAGGARGWLGDEGRGDGEEFSACRNNILRPCAL